MPSKIEAAATRKCDECGEEKDISSYNKAVDGSFYDNCKDCFLVEWRANQLKFWTDKLNRKCGLCKEVVPLSLYTKDSYGIPYKNCRACAVARSERLYLEAKAGSDGKAAEGSDESGKAGGGGKVKGIGKAADSAKPYNRSNDKAKKAKN
jgi:hypothetical protein